MKELTDAECALCDQICGPQTFQILISRSSYNILMYI